MRAVVSKSRWEPAYRAWQVGLFRKGAFTGYHCFPTHATALAYAIAATSGRAAR